MSRINGFSAKYFPMQSLWIGEILLLIFSTFSGITSTAYMMVLNFLKSSRPSLPLKKAPPLISVFSPQARRRKPPSGARNRYAIRLADHQRSSPYCAGWDRLGHNDTMCISLMLIYTSLRKTKTSNKYIVISTLTLLQIQRNLQHF